MIASRRRLKTTCPAWSASGTNYNICGPDGNTDSIYYTSVNKQPVSSSNDTRKKERILFATTELTNKIDTFAEISMEACQTARVTGASRMD